MKGIARTLATLWLLAVPVFAADLVNVSGPGKAAVSGYDPVAFFTDSKPTIGSPLISATYQGAVYYFATEDHRKLFEQDPARYAPQYGGFCAYGVGQNALVPVDISTWQVRNGKLYLNLNAEVLKKFNADFGGSVARAEKYWPGLVAKKGQ
jgi:hypothetical protein